MRTTASYELFPDAPSERAMARARYLAREGRVVDAEAAYREVLAAHPDLKPCWAECFELLRREGRKHDALRLAEGARAQFGDSAFALALKGAALIELERYRDALGTLGRQSRPIPTSAWCGMSWGTRRSGWAIAPAPCWRSTAPSRSSRTPRRCGCVVGSCATPGATRRPRSPTRGRRRRRSTRSSAQRPSARSSSPAAMPSMPRVARTT